MADVMPTANSRHGAKSWSPDSTALATTPISVIAMQIFLPAKSPPPSPAVVLGDPPLRRAAGLAAVDA